jgi:hypothetical protein
MNTFCDAYRDAMRAIHVSAVDPDGAEPVSQKEAGEEIAAIDLFETDTVMEHLEVIFSDIDAVDAGYINECVQAYQDGS